MMDVIALVSGGKDSCYNMMQCVAEGHRVVALANLKPEHKDELDSYMYQTVGHHAIELYAEAMDLPLYRRTIKGSSLEQGKDYVLNPEDEVEDLYQLLKTVKEETQGTAVSVGAILSDYQRVRVEHVCMRLGLTPLAYLWRREQEGLLKEMIDCQVHAILIKVAALGLDPKKHLGKTLAEIYPHMQKMQSQYGLNMCGEGGEYETFTLDCPLFKKRIVMDDFSIVMHSDDAFAPVAYMNLNSMHLEPKPDQDLPQAARIEGLPLTTSKTLMQELEFTDTPSLPVSHEQPICPQECISGCPRKQVSAIKDTVYISGVYGMGESVEQATQNAFTQLKGALEENDLTLADLAAVHLYVANMTLFHQINAVYKSNFSINPPIRVCVEVSLPENVVLQMDCVASRSPRSTMHVQGLSHWAPANIGPYSQAVMLESGHLHIAGQIGMTPADLSIIAGGPTPQARLSLRHVDRVMAAMSAGCGIKNLDLVICYVTDPAFIQSAEAEWERYCQTEPEHSALVTYMVVPALPKGASVEWQVTARLEKEEEEDEEDEEEDALYEEKSQPDVKDETICDGSFTMQHHRSMGKKSDTASIVTICTRCDTDPKMIRGDNLLPDLLCVYQDAEKLSTLQVFFKASCLQLKDLLEVYETMGEKYAKGAVQFTPVVGFKEDNCIITACY